MPFTPSFSPTVDKTKIVFNEGIIVFNHSETDAKQLTPVKGGGEFSIEKTYRYIDYDGQKGKTKGTLVVDDINATLKVTILGLTLQNIMLALPGDVFDNPTTPTLIKSGLLGPVADTVYAKNFTMIGRTVDGKFLSVKIFSPVATNGLNLAMKPKSETEIELEFSAHWEDGKDLYEIKVLDVLA